MGAEGSETSGCPGPRHVVQMFVHRTISKEMFSRVMRIQEEAAKKQVTFADLFPIRILFVNSGQVRKVGPVHVANTSWFLSSSNLAIT